MIAKEKENLSIEIMEKLKTKKMFRRCKCCGKPIEWNYKFSICNHCYTTRYFEYDDDIF